MKTRSSKISFYISALLFLALALGLAMPMQTARAVTPRYVATTGSDSGDCSNILSPCLTINYAMGQAVSGDTVNVAAGTYDEQVVITQSLTLQGVGDTTIVKPSSAAILTQVFDGLFWYGGTKNVAGIIVANVSDGSAVTVKNLKVDESTVTTKPTGSDYLAGIFYRETGGTVDTVSVVGGGSWITTTERAYGMYLSAATNTVSVEVKGSTITNYDKNGIEVMGNTLTANIHNNTITGRGTTFTGDEVQNGVSVGRDAVATVNYNTISNLAYYAPASSVASGILFYHYVTPTGKSATANNNTVTDCQVGIMFKNANATAQDNTVSGGTVGLDGIFAQPNYAGAYTASFVHNTVSGITKNAAIDAETFDTLTSGTRATLTVTITNNTLTGGYTTADGIYIGGGSSGGVTGGVTATISGNTISGWPEHGINLGDARAAGATITGNTISNNTQSGIYIAATVNAANVSANSNSIFSNTAYGANNAGTGTLNASANWWGSTDPTTVAGYIFGTVDFTPLLNSGTDTDLVTPGFQPSLSSLTVHTLGSQIGSTGRIQEGINLVSGSTVNVAAGTYNLTTPIEVNKAVTLIGNTTTPSNVVVNAPAAGSDRDVFQVKANGVTIQGFTLQNALQQTSGGAGYQNAGIMVGNDAGNSLMASGGEININGGTFSYNVMDGNGFGIYVYRSMNILISHNEVKNSVKSGDSWPGKGIQLYNPAPLGTYAMTGNIIEYNNVHNNGWSGIEIMGDDMSPLSNLVNKADFSGTIVRYNTIDDNIASGLYIRQATGPITVNNNTITDSIGDNVNWTYFGEGLHLLSVSDATIQNNSLSANNAYNIWIDSWVSDVHITGNTIGACGWAPYALHIQNSMSGNGGVAPSGMTVNENSFANVNSGIGVESYTGTLNVEKNWWGVAVGPNVGVRPPNPPTYSGPGSVGKLVIFSGMAADYSPWCLNATCTATGTTNASGELVVDTTTDAEGVQDLINSVPSGTTIVLPDVTYYPSGGFTISTSGITIKLSDGTVIQASSPCFTILASNTTIVGNGALCKPDNGSSGVVLSTAVSNVAISTLEIDGTGESTASGFYVNASISNLQIVDNYIHNMGADGITYTTAGIVTGVHEVQGNLFQNNTGFGVNNLSASTYTVEYNSWGAYGGPTTGDGASGNLDFTPWTHVSLSMTSSGSPVANRVGESYQITYAVKMDAAQVFGADFDLNFAKTNLSAVSITNSGAFAQNLSCGLSTPAQANASGVISFCGNSTTALNGAAQTVFTVVFEGLLSGVVPLNLDETDDVFGMLPPGGASSNIYAAALTDGSLTVYDTATVTGRLDLQGRANDTGAALSFGVGSGQGYGGYTFSTTDYWGAISKTGIVYDTYAITVVNMARYLDVTVDSLRSATITTDNRVLNTLVLLGGDADDDNEIGISDATIIGGQYGKTGVDITIPGADINNDGTINIFDLVLMGGNYGATSDTAYAAWTP